MRSTTPTCACGLTYVKGLPEDEARHALEHSEYADGPVVLDVESLRSFALVGRYAIRRIDEGSPVDVRRRLAKAARVASREIHAKSGYDGDVVGNVRLFVLSDVDHIIGMVLTDRDRYFWRLGWAKQGSQDLIQLDPPQADIDSLKIARVWLAANYRGQGLALGMLRAIAALEEVCLQDLGWELPFTAAGAVLARAACPNVVLGAGDGFSLQETLGRI